MSAASSLALSAVVNASRAAAALRKSAARRPVTAAAPSAGTSSDASSATRRSARFRVRVESWSLPPCRLRACGSWPSPSGDHRRRRVRHHRRRAPAATTAATTAGRLRRRSGRAAVNLAARLDHRASYPSAPGDPTGRRVPRRHHRHRFDVPALAPPPTSGATDRGPPPAITAGHRRRHRHRPATAAPPPPHAPARPALGLTTDRTTATATRSTCRRAGRPPRIAESPVRAASRRPTC